MAKGKFASDQIYNWSYADEQQAKLDWDENQEGSSNPYEVMPQLNMYTYQVSAMMADELKGKVKLYDGDQVDPAFDLNEFFRTKENGKFVYDEAVDRFLDALTKQEVSLLNTRVTPRTCSYFLAIKSSRQCQGPS
ncbi:hypothetical protein [Lactobacillus johnsonii]|uniref:hypothetical protein n=1 Tax=Lactobacillus johnsonii TaxID=33959 RepID=UPI003AAE8D4C